MQRMRPRAFTNLLGILVVAGTAVSAWMLVPLSNRPLGSLSSSQGNRVIWGWALATLVFGLACLWVVFIAHAWIQRRQQRGATAQRVAD